MTNSTAHLHLADAPLKLVLQLFDPDAPLYIQELGDTQHPSAGYVDKELTDNLRQVRELLTFPYDFDGLVCFEASAGAVSIRYHDDGYQLSGSPAGLSGILTRLFVLNAQEELPPLTVRATPDSY